MNRKIKFGISLIICFLCAVFLSELAQVLHRQKHPLVSSLTCAETDDPADLYWNINQIELSGSANSEDGSVVLTLRNNIPNFAEYLYRMDGNEQWQKSTDGRICFEAGDAVRKIEIKATNTMGGELPTLLRSIRVGDRAVTVIPHDMKIENGGYRYRFEKPGSAKIAWLKGHILPVIAACPDQWSAFVTLRRWVCRQIPNRHPVVKSRWDAQRILQAVRNDPSIGFVCDAYAATYVSACVSVGLNARMLHLGDGNGKGHYAAEVWSDHYGKWIFMDPLYDCHFTSKDKTPLSAIDLHNLWKEERTGEAAQHGAGGMVLREAKLSSDYVNLFQDIQLVNANDFLSTPFTSVLDLLTLKIRFLRYTDETNPPYNRVKLAWQLFLFYYLPILLSGLIIPFVIPAYLIFMTMKLGRKSS